MWFGDGFGRELAVADMFLAVYAAGGGKRNMANFAKVSGGEDTAPFRTTDVFLFFDRPDIVGKAEHGRLHICRSLLLFYLISFFALLLLPYIHSIMFLFFPQRKVE